jgi:hypothetical protein
MDHDTRALANWLVSDVLAAHAEFSGQRLHVKKFKEFRNISDFLLSESLAEYVDLVDSYDYLVESAGNSMSHNKVIWACEGIILEDAQDILDYLSSHDLEDLTRSERNLFAALHGFLASMLKESQIDWSMGRLYPNRSKAETVIHRRLVDACAEISPLVTAYRMTIN